MTLSLAEIKAMEGAMRAPQGYFKQRLAELNMARGLPPGTRHNGTGDRPIVRPRRSKDSRL